MKDDYINSGRVNQKLETRQQILKSAQHFLNLGMEISLEEIAKHAGVSRATIYRYFSNKEVLATEAGLDIKTKKPEEIVKSLEGKSTDDIIFGIQDYYNKLAIKNENAFRKYLSVVLSSNPSEVKRGARRNKTLQLALQNTQYSEKEKEDLSNLLTILMGIEPLIVTKDVSGLSNTKSKELMKWGMELLLKGFHLSKT